MKRGERHSKDERRQLGEVQKRCTERVYRSKKDWKRRPKHQKDWGAGD
jgi:hypothetical protein